MLHLDPSALSQGGSISDEVCCTAPETLSGIILRTGNIKLILEHVVYSCALSHLTIEQSQE